jgi:hypothetical protein
MDLSLPPPGVIGMYSDLGSPDIINMHQHRKESPKARYNKADYQRID